MAFFAEMRDLHPVQTKLLTLLKKTMDDPLTIREIQERLGISSPSVVHHHLVQLEKKGFLKRNPANPADYQILADEPEKRIAYVNLYGMARCGPEGTLLSGNPIDRIPIPTAALSFPARDAFLVKAKGNSMAPRIQDGDLIIARRTDGFLDNEIVVCSNEGEVYIKKIYRQDDRTILLLSVNQDFRPISISPEGLRVEGIVRGIIARKF